MTNNLEALFPDVAAEWHKEHNGALTPSAVVAASSRVAWWQCARDGQHVWRASIRDRTRDLSSCPFCSNDRVSASNSLLATHRVVAAEWHPTNNGSLTPEQVTFGSAKRVWWRCRECNHEWQATVANRVLRASRCPACVGRVRVTASKRQDDCAPAHVTSRSRATKP